jgi:Sigma-70, region 4
MVLDRSCYVSRDAPPPPPHLGGHHGSTASLLAVLVLAVGAALASTTVVAATTPPTIEDQNDRGTVNPLIEEAWRSREAVERFRAGERTFVADPGIIGHPIDPPQARPVPARPVPAAPRPGVGAVTSLLLGLVGGCGRRVRRPGRLDRCHPPAAAPAGFRHLTRRSTLSPAQRLERARMPAARPTRRTAPAPGDGGSRARARLAARREPALDPLPASNADLWRAVRALPSRQAQAVALYYLEDLSVRQTAVVLDCAEGTVRAHLAKARRTLARRLHLDAEEEP